MTVDELMAVLEGCDCRADVRLAVTLPDGSATEFTIVGAASLPQPQPMADDAVNPPEVWLLAGDAIGSAPPALWGASCRRRP